MNIQERLANAPLPKDQVGAYAMKSTRTPSLVLMTLCVLWIVVLIGDMCLAGYFDLIYTRNNVEFVPRLTWLKVVGNLLMGLGSVVIFMGSTFIFAMRTYPLARLTTFIAMVPFVTPGIVLGIPIAIWAYQVLQKREVQDSFHNID